MTSFLLTKSDLKYTLRNLVKNPGSAVLTVLILAFSLGLSIFIFTISYTMTYKPLQMTNGKSIVRLCTGVEGSLCGDFRAFEFSQLRADMDFLENVFTSVSTTSYMEYEDFSKGNVLTTFTEWNMFQLSESSALLGRTLQAFDHLPNAGAVVVLGFDSWQIDFNGDKDVIGNSISINGRATEVVGVMPEGYKFPSTSQIWLPIPTSLAQPIENTAIFVSAYARLKDSMSREESNTRLNNLMQLIRSSNPLTREQSDLQRPDQLDSAHVSSLPYQFIAGSGGGNLILFYALNLFLGLIFLLACINIGALFLARTNERLRDISIKTALGAPSKRLILQTMSEGVIISVLGGIFALLLAGIALNLFDVFLASNVEERYMFFWARFQLDGSSIFALVFFVSCTILFTTAVPAWRIVYGDFNSVMQDGTRGAVGLKSSRFSRSLIVTSIVLITLVVYLAILSASSMITMRQEIIEARTSSENLIGTELELNNERYTRSQKLLLYQSLNQILRENANIDAALVVHTAGQYRVQTEGADYITEDEYPSALIHGITGSLNTINGTLLEGRTLNNLDNENSPTVAIISRSLANHLWPEQSAIDQQLTLINPQQNSSNPVRRVVGVIGDTIMTGPNLTNQTTYAVYLPLSQQDSIAPSRILVRYSGSVNQASSVLSNAIFTLDKDTNAHIENWQDQSQVVVRTSEIIISLISGCLIFSFLMAMVGIFGLATNSIRLRTQEIGTRRALGATDKKIGMSLGLEGSKQVLIGIFVAMILSSPVSVLFLRETGGAILSIGITAVVCLYFTLLLAIYHPTKAILKMEPSEALRHI